MDPMGTFTSRPVLALALVAGAVALVGCGTGAKGDCPALASCGGSPAGSWTLANATDACQVPVVRPTQPADVTEFANHTMATPAIIAPPQPNPVVLQQTTSGDWCSSLVYNPDDTVSNANLWHDAPELMPGGTLKFFDVDHSYITSLTFSTKNLPRERNTTHFAPRCLLASGGGQPNPQTGLPAAGTCVKLATGLNAFYVPIKTTVPPNFSDITCTDASDGGCDCTYVYTVAIDDSGKWTVPAGTTTLLQDSGIFTYNGAAPNSQAPGGTIKSDFCATGGQLLLTGPNGGSLSGIQGLRTMVMTLLPP
jgi:hypothetical protein